MENEHIELHCTEGSSDKLYHIDLIVKPSGCDVIGRNGARGGTLTLQPKGSDLPYPDAKQIFDNLVKEKTGPKKRYRIIAHTFGKNGDTPQHTTSTPLTAPNANGIKNDSGFLPELLTALEEEQSKHLIQNANYWFQRKRDGKRLAIRKNGPGCYHGINKLGILVDIDKQLATALDFVDAKTFLVDGEIEAKGWFGWDLLELDGADVRSRPYSVRLFKLEDRFIKAHRLLNVVETARIAETKQIMVDDLHRLRAEGFVAKRKEAAYEPGRAGQHFKIKFVATASFIVGPKEAKKLRDGKRSFGAYLLDGPQKKLRYMGSVGCPEKYVLPDNGQIVEVRYLYCYPGPNGHIIQAKYFGDVRDDVDINDCTAAQLKIKAED